VFAVVWLGHSALINGHLLPKDSYAGTGFLVSGGGLIASAAHVVILSRRKNTGKISL
jgi:hypothetical protein